MQPRNLLIHLFLVLNLFGSFTLAEQTGDIDEVIVVGSHLDLRSRQLGSSLTVLTADNIANIGSPFVADVLRHVPGLSVSRTGPVGGLTQVRIRGSEANHVLVIIDGMEMNSPNGEFDFSSLTTANIERIEVLRGAQSGIYGSNATAGVINITTRPSNQSLSATVQLESGSLAFDRQAVAFNTANAKVQGGISLNHQRFGFNAAETGNEIDLSEQYNANVHLNWQIAETLAMLANGYYNNRTFDIDEQPAGVAVDSPGYGDNKNLAYLLGVESKSFDQMWINKLQFDHAEFQNGGFDSFGRFGDRSGSDVVSLQSRLDFDDQGDFQQRITFLIENRKEFFRNTQPIDPSQVPEQSRRLRSAGVEYFAEFFSAGLQQRFFMSAAFRSDNNDNFENGSTYHLAGRWFINEHSAVHGSIGTGVTNPSFYEQFGYFPGFYVGNPNLEPEQQKSRDLGWEYGWLNNTLTTDFTYFNLTLENEIAGFTTPVNLTTDSKRKGIEFSFSWRSTSGVQLVGSYTFTDASEVGEQELRRPRNAGAMDWILPCNNKWQFQVGLIYNGSMFDTDLATFTRAKVDSYTLANASVRYFLNQSIEGFIRLNNVFDADYQEVIGYNTPGFYASAGINISL